MPAWRKALASIHTDYDWCIEPDNRSQQPGTDDILTTENEIDLPTEKSPILFHLTGCIGDPDSMVVTEDDQLDFLIAMTKELIAPKAQNRRNLVIPSYVGDAISNTSLLLIGYRLYDWSFRVITRLIKLSKMQTGRQHPAHQTIFHLPPERDEEKAREFIEIYLRNTRFTAHWQNMSSFSNELSECLRRVK